MRDPREEPLENFDKIVARLAEVSKKLGLYCQGAAIIVNPDSHGEGPTFMQVSFVIGEVAPEQADDPESKQLRDEFDAIIHGAAASEEEKLAEKLKRDFQAGKGLFGPGDEPE